jgi:pilus assembly protein CpaF
MGLFKRTKPQQDEVQPSDIDGMGSLKPVTATAGPALPPKPAVQAPTSKPLNNPSGYTTPGAFPPSYFVIKDKVQQELINTFSQNPESLDPSEGRQTIEPIFNKALAEAGLVISRTERNQLLDMIVADILGFGPLQPLLDDETVTEIMVNGPNKVYVERGGKLVPANLRFQNNAHVLRIIERILAPLGRRVDESSPMVDARLPDGSRVNAIIPPLAIDGPSVTIRKFSKTPLTVEDLIRFGSFTEEFAQFIEAAVISRLNIIVSGGTGSGKTTLLNVLSSFIPPTERIITIEDSAELQLRQDHIVRLETRPPNIEGKGAITIRDLVINSLRMRPDRLVVGECRGGEALDMLQAMNTGHDGSMSTAHSNSPRDTLSRLETMVLMAGMELPLRAIRQQVASAVDLIVHVERLRDGSRRVVYCTEVIGMEGDTIITQDIFKFVEEGVENDKIIGQLRPTGIRPKVLERMREDQVSLPPGLFSGHGHLRL